MKFGLFYELQLPAPHDDDAVTRTFTETLEHVELADRLGFDCIWATEHHFLEDHALSSAPQVWLAAAAARTQRIRIGHGIVCIPPGFAHPARIAEQIATLDQVSGGRVEFGTGESSSRMELEGFGVDVTTKREAYLESLEQICNMMTMTPYPGFEGEHFSMPCRNVVPKPAQKPHPPLWVAGKPEVAARLGMGCLGFNAVGGRQAKIMVDAYYAALQSECVPIGHTVNPNISVLALMHCNRDADTAARNGENLHFFGFTIAKYYLHGEVRPGRSDTWTEFAQMHGQTPPRMDADSPTNAVGTPETIRAHLRSLRDAGVDQVLFLHQGGKLDHDANCRSLELFAAEVMPEFVEDEDRREARKAERLAPAIEAAMARKQFLPMPDDIPAVRAYGHFSHLPTAEDIALEQSTSQDTLGALHVR